MRARDLRRWLDARGFEMSFHGSTDGRRLDYARLTREIVAKGLQRGYVYLSSPACSTLYSDPVFASRMYAPHDPSAWCEWNGITIYKREAK